MRNLSLAIALSTVGCGHDDALLEVTDPHPTTTTSNGGGASCDVVAEALVTDTAAAPDGFALAWDAAGAPWMGAFAGTPAELGYVVHAELAIDDVTARTYDVNYRSASRLGTPPYCPPHRYEGAGVLHLWTDDPSVLDETVDVVFDFDGDSQEGSTYASWDLANFTSGIGPTTVDPADYESNWVNVTLAAAPSGWSLQLYFSGGGPLTADALNHYEEFWASNALLLPAATP